MIITTIDGRIVRTSQVPFASVVEDLSAPYGLCNVLRETSGSGLVPLTSPGLLDLRLDCDSFKDDLWRKRYSSSSGVYVVGDKVYVVHGMDHPLIDHERLRAGISEGLVNYGVRLRPEESVLFVERKIKGLRDYTTFLEETRDGNIPSGEQYGVVADISLVVGLPNDTIRLSEWVKDPRAIMFAGGKKRVESYAEVLSRNKVERSWLSLDTERGKEDRGRLVFVEGNSVYGFYGYSNINFNGRVVGVAPKAQIVSGAVQPSNIKGPNEQPLEERIKKLDSGLIIIDGVLYQPVHNSLVPKP